MRKVCFPLIFVRLLGCLFLKCHSRNKTTCVLLASCLWQCLIQLRWQACIRSVHTYSMGCIAGIIDCRNYNSFRIDDKQLTKAANKNSWWMVALCQPGCAEAPMSIKLLTGHHCLFRKKVYHEIVLVLALNRRPNISCASAVCSFLLSL